MTTLLQLYLILQSLCARRQPLVLLLQMCVLVLHLVEVSVQLLRGLLDLFEFDRLTGHLLLRHLNDTMLTRSCSYLRRYMVESRLASSAP